MKNRLKDDLQQWIYAKRCMYYKILKDKGIPDGDVGDFGECFALLSSLERHVEFDMSTDNEQSTQ